MTSVVVRARVGFGHEQGWAVVAVSVGGGFGAWARWGLSELLPHQSGDWPTATLITNISGCVLMGVLMAVIVEIRPGCRLLRPFLGVGVLGGYTTFSTYAVDTGELVIHGNLAHGATYLTITLLGALVGTQTAMAVTRWAIALKRTS